MAIMLIGNKRYVDSSNMAIMLIGNKRYVQTALTWLSCL